MMTYERGWSLGAHSSSFQERGVLDVLGHNLRRVYGEPEGDNLPDRLRDLVLRLQETERESLPASDR
jgi:hypothetical protein